MPPGDVPGEGTPPGRPDYDPKGDPRALEDLWLDKLAPYGDRGYHARPKGT